MNEQSNKDAQKEEAAPQKEQSLEDLVRSQVETDAVRALDRAQAARWKQLAKEKGVE